MVIIVEGPDGSGKTTLCRSLERIMRLPYQHYGPPPAGVGRLEYYKREFRNKTSHNHGYIFDRFALGELVYGPILRPGQLSFNYRRYTKSFLPMLRRMNVMTIICLPRIQVCESNWPKTKQLLTPKQLVESYADWQILSAKLLEIAPDLHMTYSYLHGSPRTLLRRLGIRPAQCYVTDLRELDE